jgi:hypothetical protein
VTGSADHILGDLREALALRNWRLLPGQQEPIRGGMNNTSLEVGSMFRRFLASVILATSLLVSPALATQHTPKTAAASGKLVTFDSEGAAQAHCPNDTVVWLNTNSGIYHEKGMRWYGRTKHGAYVCRSEADAAGDRDTRNGQ